MVRTYAETILAVGGGIEALCPFERLLASAGFSACPCRAKQACKITTGLFRANWRKFSGLERQFSDSAASGSLRILSTACAASPTAISARSSHPGLICELADPISKSKALRSPESPVASTPIVSLPKFPPSPSAAPSSLSDGQARLRCYSRGLVPTARPRHPQTEATFARGPGFGRSNGVAGPH